MTEIDALNLTLTPVTPGFTFVPEQIKIYIGQIKVKFRVSIPLGFAEGEYEVNWETKGDLESPIYTPIKKTTVIVTGKGSRHSYYRRHSHIDKYSERYPIPRKLVANHILH